MFTIKDIKNKWWAFLRRSNKLVATAEPVCSAQHEANTINELMVQAYEEVDVAGTALRAAYAREHAAAALVLEAQSKVKELEIKRAQMYREIRLEEVTHELLRGVARNRIDNEVNASFSTLMTKYYAWRDADDELEEEFRKEWQRLSELRADVYIKGLVVGSLEKTYRQAQNNASYTRSKMYSSSNELDINLGGDRSAPSTINNFRVECPICLTSVILPVVPDDKIRCSHKEYMVTPCYHVFHAECLRTWMKHKLQCPVCRQTLYRYEMYEALVVPGNE
ncbi:hypothetical protein DIURU_004452 [Diutina rugosa]|uniref:RING-type domain-containing protein n=1 Tax=Diutina rugosa TaxID=5481 RepID=A0A642UHD2_DIURU|nr:uncharacterized protein DIURU_004452 [Diutina rugosa]KAA8899071.1 hypothetical protein DIURU_004452 [Diutina rugosa]